MRIRRGFFLRRLMPVLGVAFAVVLVRQRRASLAGAPRDAVGPLPVRVATAEQGTLALRRDFVGVVEAHSTVELAARVTAPVRSVAVREGDVFAAGAELVVLQDDDWRTALAGARAQTAAAEAERVAQEAGIEALERTCRHLEREWNRQRALREADAAAEQQEDVARERLDEALGRLSAARARLVAAGHALEVAQARERDAAFRLEHDTRLVCGEAGVVLARRAEPGDLAVPGRTLLVVASPARRLAFDVPQEDLALAVPGAVVTWGGAGGCGGTSAVSRVHPALDASRMRRAEADLDAGPGPLPALGAYVPVRLDAGWLRDVTLVPAGALALSPDAAAHVFVVEDGRLRSCPVERLGREGDRVAVRGVAPGAVVVLHPFLGWATLGNGRAVEILP